MKVFRNTVILVLIFAALFGFYFINKKSTKVESKKIFDFKYTQIKGINLYKDNVDVFDLSKNNNTWTITKPFVYETELKTVNSTLKTIANLSYSMVIKSNNISDYGFDKPMYQVDIKLDNKNVKLIVGDKTPVDSNYYVKTDLSNDIYKVDGATIDNIIPIGDYVYPYINKNLFDTNFDKLTYLKNGKEYTVTQNNGKWYFNGIQLVDSDIEQLKTNISGITVSDIDSNLNNNKTIDYTIIMTKNKVIKRVDFLTRDTSTMTLWIDGQNLGMYTDNNKVSGLINQLNSLAGSQ